jgi:RHS repeat-associated protein
VDSNDKWYYDAFDERWRLLARFRESDTSPKEDFVPHQAGDSGHGTSSYIDLVICRNRDADTAWTAASDGTLEERSYLLQNWRADVSAVVSGSGLLKEWVKYSSYGVPIGLPGGDTDSDGDCDASDITQVQTWISASAYDVRGDVDLDGDVDASDKSELQTNYQGITLGRGVLSSTAIASRKGYAGYESLTNLAGSLWLARNRVLMAELGRWGRRDPLGYVDGASLLEIVHSNPIRSRDPSGLLAQGPWSREAPWLMSVSEVPGDHPSPSSCEPSPGPHYVTVSAGGWALWVKCIPTPGSCGAVPPQGCSWQCIMKVMRTSMEFVTDCPKVSGDINYVELNANPDKYPDCFLWHGGPDMTWTSPTGNEPPELGASEPRLLDPRQECGSANEYRSYCATSGTPDIDGRFVTVCATFRFACGACQ